MGFSSSEAQGHLHTLSLWNGPLVAAPGRAQWCLYQPVKRDSPGLHQVPLSQSNSSQSTDGCSFTSVLPLRRGAPGRDAQSPNQLEQTPNGGVQASVQPNFSSNHVYFKRECLPFVYYQKETEQVKEETHFCKRGWWKFNCFLCRLAHGLNQCSMNCKYFFSQQYIYVKIITKERVWIIYFLYVN